MDHVEDLQADFRVHYRIDNIFNMESASFFSLALRVFAYKGVMRARAEAEEAERSQKKGAGKHSRSPSQTRTVAPTKAAVSSDPVLREYVDFN